MKKIKYILFIMITILSIGKVYATECYYMNGDFKATFVPEDNKIYVDVIGTRPDHDGENMLNYCSTAFRDNTTAAGHTFSNYIDRWCVWSGDINYCPEYLVIQSGCGPEGYRIWGTQSQSEARQAAADIDNLPNCTGRYASFRDSSGNPITSEDYYHSFVDQELIGRDIPEGQECESIFGDPKDEATPSLAYLINMVLGYVRIIVPVIIILLCMLDLASAVASGSEDNMKKAQTKIVKRIIMGVVIFFIPTIVKIVMWLADIVWQGLGYASCTID